MLTFFWTAFTHEWRFLWRSRQEAFLGLLFFGLVILLFPLALGGHDPVLLQKAAPGMVWVAALLATFLGLPMLFSREKTQGRLELIFLSPEPPVIWVLAKLLAHWLATGFPLVLLAPLSIVFFDLPFAAAPLLSFSLLLGSPILILLGAVGSALTLGLRQSGSLLALLVFPLYVPTLIFGSAAMQAGLSGMGADVHFQFLGALLLGSLALGPWACTAALRLAIEEG
jgi:heme exporter protein B